MKASEFAKEVEDAGLGPVTRVRHLRLTRKPRKKPQGIATKVFASNITGKVYDVVEKGNVLHLHQR